MRHPKIVNLVLIGMLWWDGKAALADYLLTPIDVPGLFPATIGINDRGQIVGTYSTSPMTEKGFLYAAGSFTSIDVPAAMCGA